ncbi:MAG: hypothetical protein JWN93_1980 [Hyphomicrobiales bacterium]|nr:hypothetical protein [Hyphomicrobiales bacterium]
MNDRDSTPGQATGGAWTEAPTEPGSATILRPFVQHIGGSARPAAPIVVSFDRRELGHILQVYGRKVAEGEWRDYAMDFLPHKAIFSVFKRTSDVPLYTIEKDPKLARRQGAYAVVSSNGMILRRGHELPRVLAVLDRRIKLVGGS